MTKVVINTCYGGFSLSKKATEWMAARGDTEAQQSLNICKKSDFYPHYWGYRPKNRATPLLVECVETLGGEANGNCASLKVVEIPEGVEWEIDEHNGMEWVAEVHRTWS